MDWFLALNDDAPAFPQYADMARVAIHTALKHTTLRPHMLYYGGENEFTAWLRTRDVPIIRHKTFVAEATARLGEQVGDAEIPRTTHGIFLRVELPALAEKLKLPERVLYTDCDVFFRKDVVPQLRERACRYFAVAPEFEPDDYENMNTGVMLMNLPALARKDAEFRSFILQNLESLRTQAWDQGAYRRFFRASDGAPLWDHLPPELNWKPYWGDYERAAVVHFHGPKPFQRPYLESHFPELKHLAGGCFAELCEVWDELLAEVQG
ncbi:MAG TPA: glycosyltransferase [Chthoniobacterales bacterium]|nr:glycosyltransferase [Chthoniobacterales bacterium]